MKPRKRVLIPPAERKPVLPLAPVRGLAIEVSLRHPSLHVIKFIGGGSPVPPELSGFYTSEFNAEKAIAKYLAGRRPRV